MRFQLLHGFVGLFLLVSSLWCILSGTMEVRVQAKHVLIALGVFVVLLAPLVWILW
jgi:hypothetical protein